MRLAQLLYGAVSISATANDAGHLVAPTSSPLSTGTYRGA
jgi:hypothetical protein